MDEKSRDVTPNTPTAQREEPATPTPADEDKVGWLGYVMLAFALVLFSGVFAKSSGALSALDFNAIAGKFGTIKAFGATFMGAAGTGARAGFLFSLSLIPVVMLAMGVMEIIEKKNGLKAAQRLLSPLMRPIMGVPGAGCLILIASFQSADAGAGLTKNLCDDKIITNKERIILSQFQLAGGGMLVNYLSSGAALFSIITVGPLVPLGFILAFKFLGANMMRLYLTMCAKDID